MNEPTSLIRSVWERETFLGSLLWLFLLPFSFVYSFGIRVRNFLYSFGWMPIKGLPCAVVSVGNLVVGGTGKTPTTLWLAQELGKRGYRVAILSRGYKRTGKKPVVLEPGIGQSDSFAQWKGPLDAGDEPVMMAAVHGHRVGVGRKRYQVANMLLGFSVVDVFLLDDGFQHRQLRRDLDLLLLGWDWNGWLIPAGPFREPRSALARAHLYLITGSKDKWKSILGRAQETSDPFFGSIEPKALLAREGDQWTELPLSLLSHAKVLTVCAIANPYSFYRMIQEWEAEIVDTIEFSDHHRYSIKDWKRIINAARHADRIVTTEKDMVKLAQFPFAKRGLLALRVSMVVESGDALVSVVERTIHEKSGRLEDRKETSMAKGAVVFVDRDGTLIREVGYLNRVEQIEILPGVPKAIQLLHHYGVKVVMVTNQSAVARGFVTEEGLNQIHREIESRLAVDGAFLDGIYYCPHHPTEGADPYRVLCHCRKPNIGLVERACSDLGVDANGFYVVGDQASDMELAVRISGKGILLKNPTLDHSGDRLVSLWVGGPAIVSVERDFEAAAQWIIQDLKLGDRR
jgi:tetraacyldisaccharide 4'-kinase